MSRRSDKLFKKQKELKFEDFARKDGNRKKKIDCIIACEDKVSLPAYFEMVLNEFKKDKKITPFSLVIVKHKHTNPSGVLQDLLKYNQDGRGYADFDYKWVVIDRDSDGHLAEDFNKAFEEAKKSDIEVIYSNDCFELWYLLHFDYIDTAFHRDEIIKKVIRKLQSADIKIFGKLTKKNIKSREWTKKIYYFLAQKQQNAIKNAEKLLRHYGNKHSPERDNPSTNIHCILNILLHS